MDNSKEHRKAPEPFWMVWDKGTRNPSKKHFNLFEAHEEARRLSEEVRPGRRVYVLEAIGSFKKEMDSERAKRPHTQEKEK